jgi:hypothetical protein
MRGHAAYTLQHQRPSIATKYKLSKPQYEYIATLIKHHDTPPDILDTPAQQEIDNNNAYPAFLLMTASDIAATQ